MRIILPIYLEEIWEINIDKMLNYRFRLTKVCNILKDFTDIQRKWALSENFLDAHCCESVYN